MGFGATLLILIVVLIVSVFVIRLFGAWMLRIDEVIDLLEKLVRQNDELLKSQKKLSNPNQNRVRKCSMRDRQLI
jgi:hypothetical protein